MITCLGILSYSLIYMNGQMSKHSTYVTREDRVRIEQILSNKQFRKDFEVYQVNDKKFTGCVNVSKKSADKKVKSAKKK